MAEAEVIPPEPLTTTFSTHVHYLPTEDVSFAEEYVPLRYVGARQ